MQDADTAVVTVSDRNYLPAACCQLVSTQAYLSQADKVQLFLVVCDVNEDDLRDAADFFEQRRMSVEIVMPPFAGDIKTLPTRWPRAAYLRLYFDRIFGERWRRVVYFDADTRVCSPLGPLLHSDLHGQPVGAVHDFIYYVSGNIHRRRGDLGLRPDAPYFQSGVMVFDWHAMLACDGLAQARRYLEEHPEACYEAPDQDALNATFEGRWTPLDPRWNLHELYLMFGKRLQPWIRHFTSAKPWANNRPKAWREPASWYRRELANSPWPDFVEPQSKWQAVRVDVKFMMKRHYPRLREAVAPALPGFVRTRLPRNRYLPWTPRHTGDVEAMAHALVEEAAGRRSPLRPPEAVLTHGSWHVPA